MLNNPPVTCPAFTSQIALGNTISSWSNIDRRGFGAKRLLSRVNDQRMLDVINLSDVPHRLVERVEIVTGGRSTAYSFNSVAGADSIIIAEKTHRITAGETV